MQTENVQYGVETSRLLFLEGRDGVAGALAFAEQSIQQYRRALLQSRKRGHSKPHHASLPEYRAGFVKSYLGFKKYIQVNS